MLFRTEKGIFQDALEKVTRVCKRSTDTNGVLIEVIDGTVTLTCTDLITTIKSSFKCMDFENGSVLLEGRFLISYIKALSKNEILFQLKDNKVLISAGKSKSNIISLNISKFPKLKIDKKGVKSNLVSSEFKKGLREVLFASAKDETRPILTGILFEIKNSFLTLVGLDGYRLSSTKIPIDTENDVSAVVPGQAALEIKHLLENSENNIHLTISENNIIFENDSVLLESNLLEGSYIKWESIVPDTSSTVCTIKRAELLNTLNRVEPILKGEQKLVKLNLLDTKLSIEANSEIGKINDELNLEEFQGNPIDIAFNEKYLQELLVALEDEESIVFNFITPVSPVVVSKKNQDSYTGLILPVRLLNN